MIGKRNKVNLIFISVDSLRHDALTAVHTPHLLKLAETAGCLFDEMIVQTPFTVPSHASMLTGLYPFNHRLRQFSGQKLYESAQTLFEYLACRGYDVAIYRDTAVFGAEHGYSPTHFQDTPPPTLSELRRFLSRQNGQPFCLFIHYWGVHTPYDTLTPVQNWRDAVCNLCIHLQTRLGWTPFSLTPSHPYWLKRLEKVRSLLLSGQTTPVIQGYQRALRRFDNWLANFYKLLQQRRLTDNTLLVITSDHGECFNEHGEARLHPDGYEHGLFLFENVLRVPALFVGPNVPAGQRFSGQVESVDLTPTIYELLGFANAADPGYLQIDGRSLISHWQEGVPGKPFTYSETLNRGGYLVMGRSKRYKFIQDRVNNQEWLFDLEQDAGERTNLITQQPEIRQQLATALEHFEAAHKQPLSRVPLASSAETAQVRQRLRTLGYVED